MNQIFIAFVGVASQALSMFKLVFGRPRMLVIESVEVDEEIRSGKNTARLIKKLSSVFNNEEDENSRLPANNLARTKTEDIHNNK